MSELKFPAHRAHLGVWQGTYRHIDINAQEEELIKSHVVCEFPETDVFYRQTIKLTHPDGSVTNAGFDGVDRGDHLWFDTPTFRGKSWETVLEPRSRTSKKRRKLVAATKRKHWDQPFPTFSIGVGTSPTNLNH